MRCGDRPATSMAMQERAAATPIRRSSDATARWGKVPSIVSNVPVPAGWPTIRMTYDNITRKLNEPGTVAQKSAAIAYWKARLDEDLALIMQNKPPATSPVSPPAPY